MINFGKYAILTEITHYFEKEPQWWWKIKPLDSGMELDMSIFLAHKRVITDANGRREMPPTSMEVAFREIALTFGGTNIPSDPSKSVEDGGEPIVNSNMSPEHIEAVLRKFPRDLLMEVWKAVGEANPTWGPALPQDVSDPNF